MTIEVWNQPRRTHTSEGFSHLQRSITARLRDDPEFSLQAAVSSTHVNWMQCRRILRERVDLGNASQEFFYESPLQVDLVLSEDEAILSFPKTGGDREFGIHIRSPRVVAELREIFSSHLNARSVSSKRIRATSDITEVGRRLQAGAQAGVATANR